MYVCRLTFPGFGLEERNATPKFFRAISGSYHTLLQNLGISHVLKRSFFCIGIGILIIINLLYDDIFPMILDQPSSFCMAFEQFFSNYLREIRDQHSSSSSLIVAI